MHKVLLVLGLFWFVQSLAHLCFKLSSLHPGRAWLYFCVGHAVGVPSLWLLILLYKQMNQSVAYGLAMGGAFLAAQLALFIVFRPTTSLLQWAGALAIAGGMVLLAAGGPRQADPAQTPAVEPVPDLSAEA